MVQRRRDDGKFAPKPRSDASTRRIWTVDESVGGGVLFLSALDVESMGWSETYGNAKRRAVVRGTAEDMDGNTRGWQSTLESGLSDHEIAQALNEVARQIMERDGSDVIMLMDTVDLIE